MHADNKDGKYIGEKKFKDSTMSKSSIFKSSFLCLLFRVRLPLD